MGLRYNSTQLSISGISYVCMQVCARGLAKRAWCCHGGVAYESGQPGKAGKCTLEATTAGKQVSKGSCKCATCTALSDGDLPPSTMQEDLSAAAAAAAISMAQADRLLQECHLDVRSHVDRG